MTTTTTPSVSNALFKFYAQAKNKEEAEKLVEYIDVFFNVKAKEMMEQYVTKDFLKAELSQIRAEMSQMRSEIRAEIRAEMSQMRVEMSQLSESLTKQFHNMMVKTILTILIPIMLMMLGIYLK